MPMKGRALLRLYPARWQERYGEELVDLLETEPFTFSLVFDIARGAVRARLHPEHLQAPLVPAVGNMSSSMLRRPAAFLPVAMSLAAMGIVGVHVALFGTARQADARTGSR